MKIKPYLLNCFLLLIPLFAWNILLVDYLPKNYSPTIFEKDIPKFISYGENTLRFVVFVLPAFMIFSLKTSIHKIGLAVYLIGILIYFMSWGIQIVYPHSAWSTSAIGFTAPAFTTIIWFIGIGLIGNKSYLKIPHLSAIYISFSILFAAIHTTHAYLVFLSL